MTDPTTPVGLGELPGGIAPSASFILSDDSAESGVGEGRLLVRDDLIFRIYDPLDADGTAENPITGQVITVAADAELGSPVLAAALATGEPAEVLDGLAFGMALVPVIAGPEGYQAAAFAAKGGGPADLLLFSSAVSYAAFVGSSVLRHFVVRHGVGAIELAVRHAAVLRDLVLDPGQPHSTTLPVSLFVEILSSAAAEGIGAEVELDEEEAESLPVAFKPALTKHWALLDLRDEEGRDQQIRELVKRQTRSLSDRGAGLRQDMRVWLRRMAQQAASAGGRDFGFLLSDVPDSAAAVSVVTYWHELGPTGNPLDQLEQTLLSESGEGDALVRLRVDGDEVLRHGRVRSGAADVGGSSVPLLLIDYWIAVPGSSNLAQVSFTTPHVMVRDAITAMTDTIVLNGSFVS